MILLSLYAIAFLSLVIYTGRKFSAFCRLVAKNEGREKELEELPIDDGGANRLEREVMFRLWLGRYDGPTKPEARKLQKLLYLGVIGFLGLVVLMNREIG